MKINLDQVVREENAFFSKIGINQWVSKDFLYKNLGNFCFKYKTKFLIPFIDFENQKTWLLIPKDKELTADRVKWEGINNNQLLLGVTQDVKLYVKSIDKTSHWLISGTTGAGKTNFIRLLLTQLETKERHSVIYFDGKTNKIASYNNTLTLPIKYFNRFLDNLKHIMDIRLNKRFVYLNQPNDFEKKALDRLFNDRILVIVDEFASVFSFYKKKKELLIDIIQRCREANIKFIFATQHPSRKTLTTEILANVGTRVCFRTADATESSFVLKRKGAEFLNTGTAIFVEKGEQIIKTPLMEKVRWGKKDETCEIFIKGFKKNS